MEIQLKTLWQKSEKVRIWAILTPFWAVTPEPEFFWTWGFLQNEPLIEVYLHSENQIGAMRPNVKLNNLLKSTTMHHTK